MKTILIAATILFSSAVFADVSKEYCVQSAKDIEGFQLGRSEAPVIPYFEEECFQQHPLYIKLSLEAFAKTLNSNINMLQSMEDLAKNDKNNYLKQISDLKGKLLQDLAVGPLSFNKKMEYRMALGNIAQDSAIKQRTIINEFTQVVYLGSLIEKIIPFLKNDNEFIERTLGYSNVEEVIQLKDLLNSYNYEYTESLMEYKSVVAQFDAVGIELRKVDQVIGQ